MTIRGPDPFAVPAQGTGIRDDPFARARAAEAGEPTRALRGERSDTLAGHLAERDPHAPRDDSATYQLSGPSSLDDLLRRARLRGFAAGAAAGAALVAGAAALWAWWVRAPAPVPAAPAFAVAAPALAPRAAPPGPQVLPLPLDAVALAPAGSRPPRADVSAAVEARRGALEACAAEHPAASGPASRLTLTVAGSGRVVEVSADDVEVGATELGACVHRVARELRLDPFDGDPVRVEVPLPVAGRP